MSTTASGARGAPAPRFTPPGDFQTARLIAVRAALESLRDRATQMTSGLFSLVGPLFWVLVIIRPAAPTSSPAHLASLMTIYLLVAGLLPANFATGVAAGQFAGEKEKGNLAPLLSSPASNFAIFAGKILGAVTPALLYSLVAEATYLMEIWAFLGKDRLSLLQPGIVVATLAMVPVIATFAAGVAALISSRVRTYQVAQGVASLALMPVYVIFFGLVAELQVWGSLAVLIGAAVVTLADIGLIALAAATWRREEVLAKR
ncbi:MAG TPA: hypothetical protein VF808_01690 [Ktedonobacterales bacterium]